MPENDSSNSGGSLKTCPDCGISKPHSEFGRNKHRPDGLAFYCKDCCRVRSRAQYRKKRASEGATVRERFVAPDGHKRCSECRAVKPVDQFHRSPRQSDGLNSYCKDCRRTQNRAMHLKRTYGISPEEYDALIEAQGGDCACCRERKPVHVDHDHVTGAVRGVVCFQCNVAIGQFDDRIQLMLNAIDYLERTTWQRVQTGTGVFQLTSPRPAAAASPSSSALQRLISSRRG